MVDDKKAPPKEKEKDLLTEVSFLLGGLLLLGVIATQLFNYLDSLGWGSLEASSPRFLNLVFYPFLPKWKVIAVVITGVCIPWAVYSARKVNQIEEEEKNVYSPKSELEAELENKNEKWQQVVDHAFSNNPSDWRLAIIEADIMLDEALRAKGYIGDGIGEMLKVAGPGEIQNLEAAWEAHKVRNQIAHTGSNFELSERDTRRTVILFEAVLKELGAI